MVLAFESCFGRLLLITVPSHLIVLRSFLRLLLGDRVQSVFIFACRFPYYDPPGKTLCHVPLCSLLDWKQLKQRMKAEMLRKHWLT